MKKKLILFITLVSTLCSANIAFALRVICKNTTNESIKFIITTGWCGKKEIQVAPKSSSTIDIDNAVFCRPEWISAEAVEGALTNKFARRQLSYFERFRSPQEHHVDYAYEADGVHVKGIQITSPTPGMYE